MTFFDRRRLLGAGLAGVGAAATIATAHAAPMTPASRQGPSLTPDLPTTGDATSALQAAIDQATALGLAVDLPAGSFEIAGIRLPSGASLSGVRGRTQLAFRNGGAAITIAPGGKTVSLSNLDLDLAHAGHVGLLAERVDNLHLEALSIFRAAKTGIHLTETSGRVSRCHISECSDVGIFSIDATNLSITDNTVERCGNNAIQVWRSSKAHDGTILTGNRISRIAALSGGTGQNGNGINLFRADDCLVCDNHISDCAYSAIRANASSNAQIISNACHRLGEVAIYAEFGFQGAVISQNLIDTAATGISVTNFNEGGRLAVVQGNLVRNLFRRPLEPVDKRGIGIYVEADSAVSGNTVENAADAGIVVGYRKYMRDCAVTGNVVRSSPRGILLSSSPQAGACLVANNMISGAKSGAIKGHDGKATVGRDLAGATTNTDRISITGNLAV